jgi:hypothetical protein
MIRERYYVFRHNNGLDISYLGGDWVDSLEDAHTFESEEIAIRQFGYAKSGIQYTHVIGKLVTTIDPLYVMKVIK